MNFDRANTDELCPRVLKDWTPVYDGGCRITQDEDGNVNLKNFTQERLSIDHEHIR